MHARQPGRHDSLLLVAAPTGPARTSGTGHERFRAAPAFVVFSSFFFVSFRFTYTGRLAGALCIVLRSAKQQILLINYEESIRFS